MNPFARSYTSASSESTCLLVGFGCGPEIHRSTAEPRITATQASSMTVSPMLSQPR